MLPVRYTGIKSLVLNRTWFFICAFETNRAIIIVFFLTYRLFGGIFNSMDPRIEDIKTDIVSVTEKLDALRAGQTVNTGFLIERLIGDLESNIRDELSLINEAIK